MGMSDRLDQKILRGVARRKSKRFSPATRVRDARLSSLDTCFLVETRISREVLDRATCNGLVHRFYSRVKHDALERGAQVASFTRRKARVIVHRPVREQVSRALSCEASRCAASTMPQYYCTAITRRLRCTRACVITHPKVWCKTPRSERKLAFG